MEIWTLSLAVSLGLALTYMFLNGFNDASSLLNSLLSFRDLAPLQAVVLAAICAFAGPLLLGEAVARTIADSFAQPGVMDGVMVGSALAAALLWVVFTWWWGLPSSSSHALMGGMVGAIVAGAGLERLNLVGVCGIAAWLVIAPVIALGLGMLFRRLLPRPDRGTTGRTAVLLARSRYLPAMLMALSHGANDAQKTVGLVTMLIVSCGFLQAFAVPSLLLLAGAAAMALGTLAGGIFAAKRTRLGGNRLKPAPALATQCSGASVALISTLAGTPVSCTHLLAAAIVGAAAAEQKPVNRWRLYGEITATWLLAAPAAGALAVLIHGAAAWI